MPRSDDQPPDHRTPRIAPHAGPRSAHSTLHPPVPHALHPSLPVHTAADIGAALRALRKDQRLTQADAAGLSDVGIRFLSELENGKPTVRLETLLKVLAAYGLELRLCGPGLEEPEPSRRPAGATDPFAPGRRR